MPTAGSAYYFFIIIFIWHETTAAARWALLLIVRAPFNDAITVAGWTDFGFHVCSTLTTLNRGSRSIWMAAAAVTALPARSFLIDGEAIVTDDDGLAVFELTRRHRRGGRAGLCAFDLIELNGDDLRRLAIEQRKAKLAGRVRGPHPGAVLNAHYKGDGEIVFKHTCKLGCEGIVSKRLGSPYRSGRVAHWLKVKNPAALEWATG